MEELQLIASVRKAWRPAECGVATRMILGKQRFFLSRHKQINPKLLKVECLFLLKRFHLPFNEIKYPRFIPISTLALSLILSCTQTSTASIKYQ